MNSKRSILKILGLALIACLSSNLCKAQDAIIHFDEKGKVYGELPQKIFDTNNLKFYVSGTTDPVEAHKKNLQEMAKKALANIAKLEADADKMKLLDLVYGINDLSDIKRDLTTINGNPVRSSNPTYVPALTNITQYYSIKPFPSAVPEFGFAYNSETAPIPAKPSEGKQLGIYLYRTDLLKKAIFDWYSSKAPARNITAADRQVWQDALKEVNKYITAVKPLIETAEETISDLIKLNPSQRAQAFRETIQTLDTLTSSALTLHNTIQTAIPDLQNSIKLVENKEWIMHWFWYQTNGLPQLNPFPFASQEALGQEPDTSGVPALRLKIQSRESFLKNADFKTVSKALIDSYIDEIDSCRQSIATMLIAYKKYQEQKKNNAAVENDFAQTKLKLNELLLYISNIQSGIYWMRHHDGSDDATSMDVDVASEYLETDRVVILTHNLTKDQKSTVQLSYTDIQTDRSMIGDLTDNVLKQLNNYIEKNRPGAGLWGEESRINTAKARFVGQTINLADDLKILQSISNALTYLLAQQNPEMGLKENPIDNTNFHSEKKQTPKVNGAKQATYTVAIGKNTEASGAPTASTLSTSSQAAAAPVANNTIAKDQVAPVDTFHYRVNKRYRLFPMAGFAYTLNNFQNVESNGDGSAPSKVTQEQQAHFIIGLKVFVKKTDIRNNKFIFGTDAYGKHLFLTRLHIDAAVDIMSPLNNIYTGVGLDLWPGFSINGGTVFNKYNYNQYANGQNTVSRTLYRTGFYIGLTTDVSVVADVLKLLNVSK